MNSKAKKKTKPILPNSFVVLMMDTLSYNRLDYFQYRDQYKSDSITSKTRKQNEFYIIVQGEQRIGSRSWMKNEHCEFTAKNIKNKKISLTETFFFNVLLQHAIQLFYDDFQVHLSIFYLSFLLLMFHLLKHKQSPKT